ncbi:DUF2867 domain-containing protein [Chromobacterium subtsugae]|uniref:DUF2867 domain-containing protein n=1 Tax=Chromobacterium subtsugae TaxID=251747 RepID=A0ABS7F801_9NEIS|nr:MULTISPECIES: DUF2867 domain-containing protein [Chromobacterium]KUM01845.1 hypothetical protein Cv017_06150 [Chromobacterium subtsugae]KZE83158.1 hypothetical protein AWB61_05955 [Chromobacterium sp. F49]MBW7567117.1 DUF2867 domain-containing protein [Chromobacterium subtsugae]MBW8286087.1 DUF2867 domain-containing protein [Chromobacterium subtsugae]WSE91857.1 DUF2867 domain-containing protein [Chromobacterium subtsugae]
MSVHHDFSAIPPLTDAASRYPWQDCCSVPLPPDAPAADAADLLRAFSRAMPPWARALMRLRDRLVSPLGLKIDQTNHTGGAPVEPFHVGQQLGVFRVLYLGERDAVLGEDDRHLDFRLVLQWRPGRLHVSTLVRPHNGLGRTYLALVTPFHHLIVAASMKRMAEALG